MVAARVSAKFGVSGSWARDAEQWRDSGGVAGVAAQRGGDVAVTVPPQDADGEVAQQAGHGAGAVPLRTWEASSGHCCIELKGVGGGE